jgi:radical SAM protein (TIGR01212 family)
MLSYGRFLRDKFGCRVYKVGINAGFNCPNRDGSLSTAGCAYCNGDSFRPKTSDCLKPVERQISEGIDYLRLRYGAEKCIASFQSAANTHAPLEVLARLYESAVARADIVGIAIGTRPDCIDEEKLAWLQRLAEKYFVTIEYGLQSTSDETLRRINRGHDVETWKKAVALTLGRGIYLGTHLILGFPGESREEALSGVRIVSAAGINFLKLHHLHVVHGSTLAEEYRNRPFHLPSLEEYAELVADFLERLGPNIYIERLFATAPADQLIAPIWGKSRAEIQKLILATCYLRSRGGSIYPEPPWDRVPHLR